MSASFVCLHFFFLTSFTLGFGIHNAFFVVIFVRSATAMPMFYGICSIYNAPFVFINVTVMLFIYVTVMWSKPD